MYHRIQKIAISLMIEWMFGPAIFKVACHISEYPWYVFLICIFWILIRLWAKIWKRMQFRETKLFLSIVDQKNLKSPGKKYSWNQIKNFFSWNCIGSFKLFCSSKIDFWPLLKLQKMEFGQRNSCNWFTYMISRVFFGLNFFWFSGPLWLKGWNRRFLKFFPIWSDPECPKWRKNFFLQKIVDLKLGGNWQSWNPHL